MTTHRSDPLAHTLTHGKVNEQEDVGDQYLTGRMTDKHRLDEQWQKTVKNGRR